MADIGLVVFASSEKSRKEKTQKRWIKLGSLVLKLKLKLRNLLFSGGFFRTGFGARLFYWRHKEEFEHIGETVELPEGLRLHILRFPFSHTLLDRLNGRLIGRAVEEYVRKNNIENCYIPDFISERGFLPGLGGIPDSGKQLLRLLLDKALAGIYGNTPSSMGDLDIIAVSGDNLEETLTAIALIESRIKCVTVVSGRKQELEEKAETLFGDMGLSIGIAADLKAAAKRAALILNFAEGPLAAGRVKIPPKALVINIGTADLSKTFPENTVINGLCLELPAGTSSILKGEIQKYFSKKDIAGLIFHCLVKQDTGNAIEEVTPQQAMKVFSDREFKIACYIGRHGTLKAELLQREAGTYREGRKVM